MSDVGVRIHVGQGTALGPLTVFPAWTDLRSTPAGYVTGLNATVDVAERAGSPIVEELVVTNRADRPVLLLGGELLEGGWQTRALAASTLLAPEQPTIQRVVCVEQGRWSGGSAHVRRARRAPVGVMRAVGSQHEVWDRVRGYADVAGSSPTESLADRLDTTTSAARDLTRGLRPLAGQRGVLVGISGRPVWLELFDSRRA
ncbi:ARPP-1 family domain-containing protein [Trujillonella humicola]|uniref:ARPP-1 family domain-containing protein n=1 Tax=Trujillonella humicola TaxID=3383699 RepID=UPI00390646C0